MELATQRAIIQAQRQEIAALTNGQVNDTVMAVLDED